MWLLALTLIRLGEADANWDAWWTYEGISGPSYWGVINPAWSMCSRGKMQSPVDIHTDSVVFDPTLTDIKVDKASVSGVLYNTGQALVFRVNDAERARGINITGGPLAYRYVFEELYVHWGSESSLGRSHSMTSALDENWSSSKGSEHTLDGHAFSAELQLLFSNADLFDNMEEARKHAYGIAAIAIMVAEDNDERSVNANQAVDNIARHLNKVVYRGQNYPVSSLLLGELLPSTTGFLTYSGSTTFPGCWESVTWMLMNKPIYLGKTNFRRLRRLMQGDKLKPKAALANNVRPVQNLNNRAIRTNVFVEKNSNNQDDSCPNVIRQMSYKTQWNIDKV